VDPDSALAQIMGAPHRVAAAMRPESISPEAFPSRAEQEQLEARVEDLLERYIEEVRSGRSVRRSESIGGRGDVEEELAAAVGQFAVALAAIDSIREGRHADAPEAIAAAAHEGVGSAVPASLRHLFKTAADFVTPGDLYKTQSLVTLGKITGA
jgi:hypothetical protein